MSVTDLDLKTLFSLQDAVRVTFTFQLHSILSIIKPNSTVIVSSLNTTIMKCTIAAHLLDKTRPVSAFKHAISNYVQHCYCIFLAFGPKIQCTYVITLCPPNVIN